MWIRKVKNRLKTDKRFRRSLCAFFIAIGLAATGISLAFFTSTDEVTNRIDSDYHTPEIALSEPRWDKAGQTQAEEFVAGSKIEKDPYATSWMPSDVYLRMKVTAYVYDSEGNAVEVELGDGESLELVTYDSTEAHPTNQYSAFLSALYYNDAPLLTQDATTAAVSSQNASYFYDDGWFYYVDDDASLRVLSYKERTAVPLFTSVHLPIFDSEYAFFSGGFQIHVTVEAVNVAMFTSSGTLTSNITDIAEVFAKGDDINSQMSMKSYDDDTLANKFTPGEVSIAVQENDDAETLYQTGKNQLTWMLDDAGTTYAADKKVQIHCNDDKDVTDCYVRACLVPEWVAVVTDTTVDADDDTDDDTTDSKTVEVLGDDGESSITFPATITGNTFTIDGITFTLAENWSENWIYQNGYFYYKKILSPGEDTEPLLESVSVVKDDLTQHQENGETLSIAVLTDAIQADNGTIWVDSTKKAVCVKWGATLDTSKTITAIQ